MTAEREQGRYFSMVRSTLESVVEESGVPFDRVHELCLDSNWPDPKYQAWLDGSAPHRIAVWVRQTEEDSRYLEENW